MTNLRGKPSELDFRILRSLDKGNKTAHEIEKIVHEDIRIVTGRLLKLKQLGLIKIVKRKRVNGQVKSVWGFKK